MNRAQVEELLYQAMETELGGVKVYEAAVRCAINDELHKEWTKYGEETSHHVEVMTKVLTDFGLDPQTETAGRTIVRTKAQTLIESMERALAADPEAAQLVAAECVVEAETKDHQNWELMNEVAQKLTGDEARSLKEAYAEVGEQEDEHLFHTMGWARELWLEALGLPAVLPPPEEAKHVKTAIGADRARQQRTEML
jgi:lipopolysaccharide biosynthesis regulator YciM